MARKQMIEGGTKNRIREVGGRQIFEHGYDGTSVRGIMLEVGGEVGLFYYYEGRAVHRCARPLLRALPERL